jgi:hypothetical protein
MEKGAKKSGKVVREVRKKGGVGRRPRERER